MQYMHKLLIFYKMSSSGILPRITRPSRVTATSATLIHNIFTNYIVDIKQSGQGLFITDISDKFPVFHIARQMEINENDTCIFKRLYIFQNRFSRKYLSSHEHRKLG